MNHQISEQEKLVKSIKGELDLLDGEIADNNDIIVALENDLDKSEEGVCVNALRRSKSKQQCNTTHVPVFSKVIRSACDAHALHGAIL
ncbi:MAG: hypothetical protein QM762_16310 [Chryseolinea sp.]